MRTAVQGLGRSMKRVCCAVLGAALVGGAATALTPVAASADTISSPAFDCSVPMDFLSEGGSTGSGTDLYSQLESESRPDANHFTKLGTSAIAYNALAFNPLDHYLYGVSSSNDLVRIGRDGQAVLIRSIGFDGQFNSGTFDPYGNYLISNSTDVIEVGIEHPGAHYLAGQKGISFNGPLDWTYAYGYLWGVSADQLWRFDPTSRSTSTLHVFGLPTGNGPTVGAWTYANGDLGFQTLGVSGDAGIRRIALHNPTSSSFGATSVDREVAPANSNGDDAASCRPPVAITTDTVPHALVGQPYSVKLEGTGGGASPSYVWDSHTGRYPNIDPLPDGLVLDPATGVVSGTPTKPGTFNTEIGLTDNGSFLQFAVRPLTFTVDGPLTITSAGPLPPAAYGSPYSATLTASDGTGPYTWSIAQGALPAGLTLDPSTGEIRGTPTAAGDSAFTAQVVDSASSPASVRQSYAISVAPASLTITATSASMTYGDLPATVAPTYDGLVSGDDPASVNPGLTCSTTATASSPVGTYPSTCSGAASADYRITYTRGSVTVNPAATNVVYTGPTTIGSGSTFTPTATLSSSAGACRSGQTVTFALDSSPTAGAAGPYALGSGTTNSSGTASGPTVSTSGWNAGTANLTASYAGTSNCGASSAPSAVAVSTAGRYAIGAGTYPAPTGDLVQFALVAGPPNHLFGSNVGAVDLVAKNKWWLQGDLATFSKPTTATGQFTGAGRLSWWNPALNHGRGGWQFVQSGAAFTVTATSTGSAGPGSFGLQIRGVVPSAGQPPLPTSAPVALRSGAISLA